MTNLGTLGGPSAAYGINERGMVVGWSNILADPSAISDTDHAVMWFEGRIIDLGTLGGAAVAYDINNSGTAVGSSSIYPQNYTPHAVLWKDGALYDLNDLLVGYHTEWVLEHAFDINEKGEIVGYGLVHQPGLGYQYRAFLLKPAPSNP